MSWETMILICAGVTIILIAARLTKRVIMGLCALVIASGLVVVLILQAGSTYHAAQAVRTANLTAALLAITTVSSMIAAGYFFLRWKISTSQNGKSERIRRSRARKAVPQWYEEFKRKSLPTPANESSTPSEVVYIYEDDPPPNELNFSEWGF